MAKTDRNSGFLVHEIHIPNRLYIMVRYISFYVFSKFSNFGLKSKCVSLRFQILAQNPNVLAFDFTKKLQFA
jgi:hypothetical protein